MNKWISNKCVYIYIYIYIWQDSNLTKRCFLYTGLYRFIFRGVHFWGVNKWKFIVWVIYTNTYIYIYIHPVSITRFPLTRFSPGSGLLRNPFFHRQRPRLSRVWFRKDGNLLMETGCISTRTRRWRWRTNDHSNNEFSFVDPSKNEPLEKWTCKVQCKENTLFVRFASCQRTRRSPGGEE